MSKNKRYEVISPDGFSIHRDKTYVSHEEAMIGLREWVKRYESQGYYSTSNRERIEVDHIELYCKIVEVKQ